MQTDAVISSLLRTGGGVLTRRDHPELAGRLDWMIKQRKLVQLLPGIYAGSGSEHDPLIKIRAAGRWAPDGILTGRAAAKCSFWPALPLTDVSLAVLSGRRSRPGFRVSRRRIPPELVRREHGIAYTVPALTALDLVPELGGDGIDVALRTGAATLESMHEVFAHNRGRNGNAERHRMLLDSRDEPWSPAERLGHRVLREGGISGWRTNVWLPTADGGCFLDIAFEREKLAIEIDGWAHHGMRKTDFERTLRRHTALEAEGWRVLHFSWDDLVNFRDWVLDKIRSALRHC